MRPRGFPNFAITFVELKSIVRHRLLLTVLVMFSFNASWKGRVRTPREKQASLPMPREPLKGRERSTRSFWPRVMAW